MTNLYFLKTPLLKDPAMDNVKNIKKKIPKETTYPRVLKLVARYKYLVIVSFLFSLLYGVFNATSVALIGPFMKTLFKVESSFDFTDTSSLPPGNIPGGSWL